ncbi:hypothetical protein BDB01DRAFT_808435, partial [Pilobolus umbonatus]
MALVNTVDSIDQYSMDILLWIALTGTYLGIFDLGYVDSIGQYVVDIQLWIYVAVIITLWIFSC